MIVFLLLDKIAPMNLIKTVQLIPKIEFFSGMAFWWKFNFVINMYIRGFAKFGIMKATDFGVLEDLTLKILEGSHQN